MDNSLNADKTLKERCRQLQEMNQDLKAKFEEQESEIIRLTKIKNQLLDENDFSKKEKLEMKAVEESYRKEIKELKEITEKLDKRN